MDLNDDGNIDVLSGCHYVLERDPLAGYFFVLQGNDQGGFEPPQILCGSDGQPLISAGSEHAVINTVPTAVDLDSDGDLDIITGNYAGTFALFEGEGDGQFSSRSRLLESKEGSLRVESQSGPFFVDWDEDGDLDLLSGSGNGGVFYFENIGTPTQFEFAPSQTFLPAAGYNYGNKAEPGYWDNVKLGDAHITGPANVTRVCAADVNGDGKLDLLVGDAQSVHAASDGRDDATVRKELAALEAWRTSGMKEPGRRADDQDFIQSINEYERRRGEICSSKHTGFVWLLTQR